VRDDDRKCLHDPVKEDSLRKVEVTRSGINSFEEMCGSLDVISQKKQK